MRTWLLGLLLALTAPAFAVSDYAREQKWADEITPGIVVGDPVYIEQSNHHKFLGIYTEAANARMALIVVHGIGIHPDWGMVGVLRQNLADQGYTTLSIQMPILAVDAKVEDYTPTYPEAVERLKLAADFLKAKGYSKIAVVSHSMGSRMAHIYMSSNPAAISAWAALGLGGKDNYTGIQAPILDMYGANDLPPVVKNAAKRAASLKGNKASKQVKIANTDHFYAGKEEEMVKTVKDFLDGIK